MQGWTYSILGNQFQLSLRVFDEKRMLTRMMLFIIMQLIRRVPFTFPTLDHHLPREWMFWVDFVLMVWMNGVGGIALFFDGSKGAFASHEVEPCSINSFRSFDSEILI